MAFCFTSMSFLGFIRLSIPYITRAKSSTSRTRDLFFFNTYIQMSNFCFKKTALKRAATNETHSGLLFDEMCLCTLACSAGTCGSELDSAFGRVSA